MATIMVPRIKLGSQGLEVSGQGLGCMGMSANYGTPKPEPDMIKLIHCAVNSGVTFLDTSDIYGPHTNEILLGKALRGGMRDKVELATKFGIRTSISTATKSSLQQGICGDPAYVRASCEESLKRLDIECIDLYYQNRIDKRIPIEVTMGELKKLVEEGKIKYVGLSEASASTIRRAHVVHSITAVQLEWSLWSRDAEEEIIPTCRQLGIGIVAYSPLGRGFLSSGPKLVENLSEVDRRKVIRVSVMLQQDSGYLLGKTMTGDRQMVTNPRKGTRNIAGARRNFSDLLLQNHPRFQGENAKQNYNLYERINKLAAKKGCTPSQLALAWLHHQGNDVCPIPGTTKIENFNQNIKALYVNLTAKDMSELESIASAVKGDRQPPGFLTWKDSNTPPLSTWKAT